MEKETVFLIIVFALCYIIGVGSLASFVAKNKNRDELVWFFLGVLYGPLALIALNALDKLPSDQ